MGLFQPLVVVAVVVVVIVIVVIVIVVAVVAVLVFTLTRIIESMVTGQAPVTLEWKNTPGKNQNTSEPKVVHTHIS